MSFLAEARAALRLWLRRPWVALPAVLSLAVGIAAGTSIFAISDAILWRPLPLPDSSRVLWITSVDRGTPGGTSPGVFTAWSADARSITAAGALRAAEATFRDVPPGDRLPGVYASAGVFPTLGVTPVIGRVIGPDDERAGAAPVILISHRLWQTRYGSRPDVLGRTVHVDGKPRTIVGVMPAPIDQMPFGFEWWAPLALSAAQAVNTGPRYLDVIARARHSDIPVLERELAAIARAAGAAGDTGLPLGARAVALQRHFAADARPLLLPLLGAVLAVVAIAAVNAANLLLAQGQGRRMEIAVRAALGADRARLALQLLVESAWLTAAAGALAFLLAQWMIDGLGAVLPLDPSALTAVRLDGRAVLFTIALVAAVTAICGLVPALRNSSTALRAGLDAGARVTGPDRLRRAFVVVQVALAVTLGTAGVLMGRTTLALGATPRGYDEAHVLTAAVQFPASDYPTSASLRASIARIVAAAALVPGVQDAALATRVPLSGGAPGSNLVLAGEPFPAAGDPQVRIRFVTPGYFAAVGTPIAQGRDVAASDDERGAPVVMVNETLARRLTAGAPAIGRAVKFEVRDFNARGPETPWRIVGVVADARDRGPREAVEPEVYVPVAQGPADVFDWIGRKALLAIRSGDSIEVDAAALRRAVAAVEPGLALFDVLTLEDRFRRHLSTERVMAGVLLPLGLTGFALAAFGLFTLLMQFVVSRRRELAVRVALGATPARVVKPLVVEGLMLTAAGLVLGLAGAVASGQALASLMFGVTASDPATLLGIATAAVATTLLAVWLPARHAASIDPAAVLRGE